MVCVRWFLSISVIALGAGGALGQTFIGLGFFPGDDSSQAEAVSADGSTVVGHGPGVFGSGYNFAWRWRPADGMTLTNVHADAVSLSANGSVIAGWTAASATSFPAYRWESSTGAQDIPEVFSAGIHAPSVSGDGQVVVGSTTSGGNGDAVRWSQQTGAVPIPNAPLGILLRSDVTNAFGTNQDGSVVVGSIFVQRQGDPSAFVSPFRWTQSAGTSILLRGDGTYLQGGAALGVSLDGNTVLIGGSMVRRWQQATGIVDIAGLSLNGSVAYPAMSGDGNTIVSLNRVWNVNTGAQDLTALLTNAGCNFSGWSGLIVTGVDFDGNTFCGYGTDPLGRTQAWYATVPAPSSALLLAAALLSANRRRRV